MLGHWVISKHCAAFCHASNSETSPWSHNNWLQLSCCCVFASVVQLNSICNGYLKCVIALCDCSESMWKGDVCHLAWLGSNIALKVTHFDRFWWGTVVPLKLWMTQTAWLGKPAALAQPSITRHFLPLLILVSSPLCVSFPVLSITVRLWIPFVSCSTLLLLSVSSISL